MRGKAIVKFRATDKKKNEKLDSKASQQRGKRGRKLGVNALTRKYYLRYNFETSKMRERAESSKNRRMDSNTEGSAPWSLNRNQMETYIHGRASHFQRGLQDFSLRDSIEAAMAQGCQELVSTAKMRMQSEKATYDEIRKMGDTFGDQHNMSFLQYITSDTPSKQLNAIKDMLQILTLYEDIYVVTDEKKSDRAAGTVQVGLHMRGHNKNVWTIDPARPDPATAREWAETVVDEYSDIFIDNLKLDREYIVDFMEKMAIGRINTLGTMYKQYARKNNKVSKKDIDNDYTVQNWVQRWIDGLNEIAIKSGINLEGRTLFDQFIYLLQHAVTRENNLLKAFDNVNNLQTLVKDYANNKNRKAFGILFEDVKATGLSQLGLNGSAVGTINNRQSTRDVTFKLQEMNQTLSASLKFQQSNDFYKKVDINMDNLLSYVKDDNFYKQLRYFIVNYAVLSTQELRGMGENSDNYLMDEEVTAIMDSIEHYAGLMAFVSAMLAAHAKDKNKFLNDKESLPGILIINNQAIYTYEWLDRIIEMLENPGETVDYKANLYFTNPTKDEIERLASAKRSALSRPEVVKKEYAGLMADPDVSKSLESLGREVWQSAKFKNTTVTMYMAKFMELTK